MCEMCQSTRAERDRFVCPVYMCWVWIRGMLVSTVLALREAAPHRTHCVHVCVLREEKGEGDIIRWESDSW